MARRTWLVVAAVVLVVAAAIAVVLVRRSPAPPAGSVEIPDDQPVEVVFGLTRDQEGLERYVGDGGPVLSLAAIADRFGATPEVRQRLSDRLGTSSVTFSTTGGLARWQTTLGDAATLGIRWDIGSVAGDQVLVPAGGVEPPDDLDGVVTEVIALPSLLRSAAAAPSSAASSGPPSAAPADPADLTSAPGCAQARQAGTDVVQAQGLDTLHAAGRTGAGARISVIAVTRFDPPAFTAWLQCIAHGPVQVHQLAVLDGGPGPVSSAETQTDLAALTLALPGIDAVTLVGAADTDWVGDALETALTDPAGQPGVITSSIVFCEQAVSAPERTVTEYVLAAAAAAGVRVVAATGDRGSAACAPGNTAPAVTYPASSPFVLAVGGSNGSREVWMNSREHSAGGGGASQSFPGRRLPDLAMLSSAPDLPPMPVCGSGCSWQSFGGTSFAAPFVAGASVAVDQARVAAGLGPLRFDVGSVDRSLAPHWFDDVTKGSNDLTRTGCCTAAAGFDTASGWGVPRFDVLARDPAG